MLSRVLSVSVLFIYVVSFFSVFVYLFIDLIVYSFIFDLFLFFFAVVVGFGGGVFSSISVNFYFGYQYSIINNCQVFRLLLSYLYYHSKL